MKCPSPGFRIFGAEIKNNNVIKIKQHQETRKLSSSDEEEAYTSNIPDVDGAKLIKNLETLAEKYKKLSNRPRFFFNDLSKEIHAVSKGSSSKYVTVRCVNETIVTIRLANHNAEAREFDLHNEDNGLSIVFANTPPGQLKNNGNAHVIEYFYPEEKIVYIEAEHGLEGDELVSKNMWANLSPQLMSSLAVDARYNKRPQAHVLNAIQSIDHAKIRIFSVPSKYSPAFFTHLGNLPNIIGFFLCVTVG